MRKLAAKGLSGLIMSSPNPERLAKFYIDVIGIPFEFRSHGDMPQHWECDFDNVHFAILPEQQKEKSSSSFVPSFHVDNIQEFIDTHHLKLLYPILDLGAGSYVASIHDIDGNEIRLWTHTSHAN